MNLYERFLALECPSLDGYVGFLLEDDAYVVARDNEGRPAFFVRHGHLGQGQNQIYKLEGISAILHYDAVVTLDNRVVSGAFALIKCTSEDEVVRRYFLELCGTLRRLLGPQPSARQIDEGINTFVRMFALRRAASKGSIIGLIGELLFIEQHADPARCIRAWHVEPNDPIDFVFIERALEVKSTSAPGRLHVVTYEQASGVPGRQLIFLSVRITPVANGMSGRQLLQRLVAQCGSDLWASMRVWEVATDTLGSEMPAFLDIAFAYEAAVQSMQFFHSAEIPAVRGNLPQGVSQVQFLSDFSQAEELGNGERAAILSLPR